MASRDAVDISKLIDDQPLRAFHVKVVFLIFLVMITDGYDQLSIGFAAHGMLEGLHIDRSSLGAIISAAFLGMFAGAPLFGWIGDRFGRRSALIIGVFVYGIVSLLTAAAQTEAELLVLRFVTGVGLSGVVANGVALVAEFAPKRVRATLVVIAQIGLTVGFMLPAAASSTVEVVYGWRSFFVLGGIAPLAIGIVLVSALPESLKFMVVARRPLHQIARLARSIDPTLQITSDTTFTVPVTDSDDMRRSRVVRLFTGSLLWVTVIIWVLYNTFLAANYFMHGWMPLLFRDQGLTVNQTAMVAAMFDVGGVFGALVISRLVDRYGVAAIVALYLLACPAVAVVGMVGHAVYLLGAVIFLAGFCLVGITLGMNAITSAVYPTEIRAKGIGWAYGVGRLGSMLGPLVGGWLIATKLPIGQLFLAPAVPLGAGAVLSVILMRLCANRDGRNGSPPSDLRAVGGASQLASDT